MNKPGPLTIASAKFDITVPEMRAAIFKSMRDYNNANTIARRCDDVARFAGMNGEDAMTMLAFQALVHVEHLERQVLDFINCTLNPPFIVKL